MEGGGEGQTESWDELKWVGPSIPVHEFREMPNIAYYMDTFPVLHVKPLLGILITRTTSSRSNHRGGGGGGGNG